MAENKEFRELVQRIGSLVQEIEAIGDPAVRATTRELVQILMEMHGTALERTMETLSVAGDRGMSLIDELGRDPIVGSVLTLHGLHPEAVESRVSQAIERVKPQLRKQGCEVEVLAMEDGNVRLRIQAGEHTCGSTAKTAKETLEGAIYDAAPDIVSLAIESQSGKPASGFVAVEQLMGAGVATGIAAE